MGSRFMDYPSPRGVHVPETYPNNDDNDPYRRNSVHSPRRNRYSRSVHQTPRVRDVAWISSPDPTPQTLRTSPTSWLPSSQVPSSPAHRPPSVIPPSPAPTVGEHMAVDDLFTQDHIMNPYTTYQPQRQDGSVGIMKSLWKGLKKLSGFQSTPYIPRTSSYESQTVEMPVPRPRAPSVASPGTDEQYGVTPYTSPYARPTNLGPTPPVIPDSLHASPAPVSHVEIPPPVTVVSPSIPPSARSNSIRSVRMVSPAVVPQNLSVGGFEPVASPVEDASQTLHEPFPDPVRPLVPFPLAPPIDEPVFPTSSGALDSPLTSKGSLSSTMARVRRFVTGLDGLPWVSDSQIADEYVPEMNPRSRMRRRVRQGAEPSWYNSRPEMIEQSDYLSQWDMWAKQSTAALMWDGGGVGGHAVGLGGVGGQGQWGVMYPRGYVPAQPGFVYPSGYPPPGVVNDQVHAPVLP